MSNINRETENVWKANSQVLLPTIAKYCVESDRSLVNNELSIIVAEMRNENIYPKEMATIYKAIDDGAENQVSAVLNHIQSTYLVKSK